MPRISGLLILLLYSGVTVANEPQAEPLELAARDLVQQFVGQLKPRLKAAMTDGGPGKAIEVCASAAPAIADSLSVDSGWLVKRVSLKARNAGRARPDLWEREVLEQFDRRQLAGENPAAINYSETVDNQYRYMQAQGVEPLCLVCHGENPPEPARSTLQQYYPDDRATGYSRGQVRGAISLSKTL